MRPRLLLGSAALVMAATGAVVTTAPDVDPGRDADLLTSESGTTDR